jgi:glycosyltransferase involved in cell wall biosynthesis
MMGPGKYGPLLEEAGVKVTCLNMPAGRVTVSGLWRLYYLLRKERPAVVQTWMYHADLIGGVMARLAGIRNLCWNIRHSELQSGQSKRSTILIAKSCAFLSSWLPRKIVCCAEKAKQVHVGYGYDSSKMVVIGNGYDLDQYTPNPSTRRKIRGELGFSERELLFGMVGRFNVQKNHHGLLRALSLVKVRGITFKCILVGVDMNTKNKKLAEWIVSLNLEDEIFLLDQRTDIPAVMNMLDVHLLSSSFGEGFPNVLAEAMACGTPCVTSNVGDAEIIVSNAGWVVPASDDVAFSNALIQAAIELKEAPKNWEARSFANARRIQQYFSLNKMVQAYRNVWEN